jgi:AraC-like DNA-binding protein
MGFISEQRLSDSPYIETITRGRTVGYGFTIRPAESHWHMVFVRFNGSLSPIVTGPLTSAGVVSYTEGAEILWIKFKLGAFMPHLPTRDFRDVETTLPGASSRSFWLKGSAWQFPDFENVETFVDRLVREDVLVRDPLVSSALQGHLPATPSRTLRHRFLRTTGLSHNHIYQIERAQRAAALLQRGVPILETVYEAGYYDQAHLTRSLKRWVGHTPAQILRSHNPG